MKYFAILSVVVPAVVAQSSAASSSAPAASATPAVDPLIPTDVSPACQTFLTQLDADTNVEACLSPILSASSQFAPGSNSTPSASTVGSALSAMCSASSGCDESAIRTQLAKFWAACQGDLTGGTNSGVGRIYDSLYAFFPLQKAVCAQDGNGTYCVTQAQSNLGSASSSSTNASSSATGGSKAAVHDAQKVLDYDAILNSLVANAPSEPIVARDASTPANATAALIPNTTTFHDTNLAFLFLSPDMAASQLCQPCTRSIVSQYISFEQDVPYGPTIANSSLLGGQTALYNAIQQKCGASFMSGAVQAAGGISKGLLSGAERTAHSAGGSIAALLAAVAVGVAAL